MRQEDLQNGVLCLLKMGRWDARVKMDKKLLPKSLPKEIVRARHDIIVDRQILKDLATVRRSAKGLLQRYSLPFPIDGVQWVNKSEIPFLDEEFEKFKEINNERLQILIDKIESMKREFKDKYPKFYEAVKHQYPSKEKLRKKFYFRWQFFQINVPEESTKILSPKIYKRETEKLRGMVKEMEEMTINMIGNMIMKRIQSLSKQCDSGKVNAGTINSFEKLFKRWDDLWKDHVDEKKLKMIVARLRKEMRSADAEDLRDDKKLRDNLAKSLEKTVGKIKNIPNFQLKPNLDL